MYHKTPGSPEIQENLFKYNLMVRRSFLKTDAEELVNEVFKGNKQDIQ